MESIEFVSEDLENLIIKDKKYYAKRRKKYLLILIPILLAIITAIVLFFVLKPKADNKIICQYETKTDDENVILINIEDNIDFTLIIDDVKYDKKSLIISKKLENIKLFLILKKN